VLQASGAAFRSGDVSVWGEWNWRLHAILSDAAARESSIGIIKNLHDQADRYARMQLSLTRGLPPLLKEHARLVALASARDADGACALLERHILGAMDRLTLCLRAERGLQQAVSRSWNDTERGRISVTSTLHSEAGLRECWARRSPFQGDQRK
jgi:DNA-binding GntR family transcriptional regulator